MEISSSMPSVTVLMSTFNGEKYIEEQISSIMQQKGVVVKLIIRDDCSSDKTVDLIKKIIETNKNIFLIEEKENIGACKSFLKLMMTNFDDQYYALSDQDDIWDDDKLIIAIQSLQKYSSDIPVLYHSNLRIVDANNKFIRLSHLTPKIPKYKYSFLVEPLTTGCTMVYNQALAEYIRRFYIEDFSMHDTWVYCLASFFGKVVYDFNPHINYRQHGCNVIGTSKKIVGIGSMIREMKRIFCNKQVRYKNAVIMYNAFCGTINNEDLLKIKALLTYKDSFFNTIRLLFDRKVKPSSLYRRFRFDLMVLLRKV